MRRILDLFVKLHTHPAMFTLASCEFALWLPIGQLTALDPYPFGFLTLSVSLWAILLSIAILCSQGDEIAHIVSIEETILRRETDIDARLRAIEEKLGIEGPLACDR